MKRQFAMYIQGVFLCYVVAKTSGEARRTARKQYPNYNVRFEARF